MAFDVGGTFIDVVIAAADGPILTYKILALPDTIGPDVGRCVQDAMTRCGADGIARMVHATTVASNTVLEGKGALTGLICTRGFRDLIEIRGLQRPAIYDIFWDRIPPLVPRRRRLEVTERIMASGAVRTPLEEGEVRAALHSLRAQGTQAVAVCFLHSYVNSGHERRAMALVREIMPEADACSSAEVLPEIREYPRASTTVLNAYLMGAVNGYLGKIERELSQYGREILIMQSNGGIMTAAHARRFPVRMIESGPAAGVLAAASLAREAGLPNVVAFDMGGTTVKACLIENGEAAETNEGEVGGGINASSHLMKGAGYALRVPAYDIVELGAGGGSIARIEEGLLMRVGPQSAGAVPGPACYGRGGTEPTVTDANVVLGYMNPHRIAGGTVPIDAEAARIAIDTHLGRQLKTEPSAAAFGVHRVVNATMARAIRSVTSERGRDPREYTLLAFGGAGPIHAAELASDIGIGRVYVPLYPGLFSSLGLLFADLRYDAVKSVMGRLDQLEGAALRNHCEELVKELRERLMREAGAAEIRFERSAELRYLRQDSELSFRIPPDVADGDLAQWLERAFHPEHERNFGYRRDGDPVLAVSVRVRATAPARSVAVRDLAASFARAAKDMPRAAGQLRKAYFGPQAREMPTRVVARHALLDAALTGPAIIEEFDTTIVIPPGWRAELDNFANVVLRRSDESADLV
ncbi:MAG TPA: hydantoinase/oxoprolinase family protein [Candidatus Binataceae bacterium]|nr:hydantoinase/oxoprolinase family protein [Candidatus Binataceae bacterium]